MQSALKEWRKAGVLMKQQKKSPLTAKPLRNPGQSIDEAIDNLITDEVLIYFLIVSGSIFLAITEWWRYFQQVPYNPILYTVVAILASSYSAYKIIRAKKQLELLKLGWDGERAVGQYLENLREDGCKVFHDLVGDNFNVDHVVISKYGIFTIETKTYSKPAQGKAVIRYDGNNITVDGYSPEKDLLVQARAEATWLKNLIKESTGKEFQIKPVIVFPGWYVENESAGFNPDVWVISPKALSGFLPKSGIELSQEDAQLCAFHISRFIRSK